MLMKNNVDHISRLESWILWRSKISKDPEIYKGYKFPEPIQAWEKIFGSECPICHGGRSGYFGNDLSKKYYCICSTLEWLQSNYYALGKLETPFKYAKLSDLKPLGITPANDERLIELVEFVECWLMNPREWIVIQGGNGTGKTHILRAIKTQLGSLCAYISVDQFQRKLFAARTTDGAVEDLVDNLSKIPVLLLDDWGLEHDNSWTTDTIASIINTRYMYHHLFPTVITFNEKLENLLRLPDLSKKRILSRILDSEISFVTALMDDDYRSIVTQNSRRKK